MAMSACDYLGIYPRNIEKADEILEAVCNQFGIDSDDVWQEIDEEFTLVHGVNFGNTVIRMIFEHLFDALERNGIDDNRIDYFINGYDTHFIIDQEWISSRENAMA